MRKVLILLILAFSLAALPASAQDVIEVDVIKVDVIEADVAEADVAEADVAEADVAEADVAEADVAEAAPETTPKQPETGEEAAETVSLIVIAARAGAWPVMIGFILMLVVWIVRRFVLKTISEKWDKATPWVAAGLGILSCVGLALSAGTLVWWRAVIEGLVSGIAASGLWELIGKRVLGSVPKKDSLPTIGESK